MPQLRWTLLCLGVLFIGLLAWFERRRQRQVFGAGAEQRSAETEQGAPTTSSGAFREPTLTLPEMRARDTSPPHDLPVVEIEEDSFKARHSEGGQLSSDRSRRSLPVMNSGPVGIRERASDAPMSAGDAFGGPAVDAPAMLADEAVGEAAVDKPAMGQHAVDNDAVSWPTIRKAAFEKTSFPASAHAPVPSAVAEGTLFSEVSALEDGAPLHGRFDIAGGEGVSEARVVEQPAFTLPPDVALVTEPIVEWPTDDLRRVVALRLVAPPPERLAGRALRLALAAEGFVLGKFSIFHKPDDSGRAVLSAASLSKPGTFDMATMDTQRYGGLSLFAVLPGPKSPTQAFDELLATARNLNERLNGALQDERGGPLTPTRIASLRETVSAEAPS